MAILAQSHLPSPLAVRPHQPTRNPVGLRGPRVTARDPVTSCDLPRPGRLTGRLAAGVHPRVDGVRQLRSGGDRGDGVPEPGRPAQRHGHGGVAGRRRHRGYDAQVSGARASVDERPGGGMPDESRIEIQSTYIY